MFQFEDLRRAQFLFDQRRFADAAAEAQRVLSQNPTNLAAWKLAGLALQLARKYEQAEAHFIEAVKKFPDDPDLWFYLARVYYLQHKLNNAEQAVGKALDRRPNHADAHAQLAMILEARQDNLRALEHYEKAIELNKKTGRIVHLPLVRAAQLLSKLGRLEESLAHLTAAAQLGSTPAEVHLLRGRVLERLGRTTEAAEEYERAGAQNLLARLRSGIVVSPRDEVTVAEAHAAIGFSKARRSGVNFVLANSATPNKYQVETMAGGVGALDYDGDGWTDIYFANGAELPSLRKTSERYWNRLFRNNRDGTFSDVTGAAGVAGEGYSMGVAVADYDNDGRQDIFVAGVNRNILFRNRGDGTFADVTARAGLEGIDAKRGKMWSLAGAWFDCDNDGHLDLFVANYCKWSASMDPYCGAALPGYRTYCFPDRYEGLPNQLFRNNGDGTFTDVSSPSGIAAHVGKGMGVAVADYDEDGFSDIFVANDTVPNFLFRNTGKGTFAEVALRAGVAVTENGEAVSSMGVDFRDYDNDGRPDLIVSALEGETFPLYRNLGKGFFSDETYPSRLGPASFRRSGWGLGLFDFNNDGHKDLFTVNAHVNDNIELYNEQTYRQPNSIFVNQKNGTFGDVSAQAGPDFQARAAHRGAAFADFNNDGRIDVVTTSLNEPTELFLNDGPRATRHAPPSNHWLLIELKGTRSNRDGLGAKLKVTSASGAVQYNYATTSVGYASSSDRRVHFGLGKDKRVKTLEVRWPSGVVQVLKNLSVDRVLLIQEASQ